MLAAGVHVPVCYGWLGNKEEHPDCHATTWIQVAYFENLQAQNRSLTPAQAMQLQRQQESAQRRHLQAIRALGTMRKLLPPAKPVKKATAPVLPDTPRFSSGCDADSLAKGVGVFN